MRSLRSTSRFRRDAKRIKKRGYKLAKLELVIAGLRKDGKIPPSYQPHKLTGDWLGFSECHIEPDWLLIYDVTKEEVLLAGTGTHSDLFKL
ncbi:MAG: type II toxin-antitoxin system YafQ family toxin [Candidatus Paceibacterota bacterium]